MKNWKIYGACALVVIVLMSVISIQHRINKALRAEKDRYKSNTEALLSNVKTYQTRDSLNAAQIDALRLNLAEYERFRAEDARLIRSLKAKNGSLQAVTTAQSELIARLRAVPRDTIVIVDSVEVPAKAVSCGDAWYDFRGVYTDTAFEGQMRCRDSILIAETVKYKRFLGFLWKTNKVKSRKVDIVSRNPHNKILGFEHILIEK